MPFILSERRPIIRGNPALSTEPGDVTFLVYEHIMKLWRENRRWATVDSLHFDLVESPEDSLFLLRLHSNCPRFDWYRVKNAAKLAFDVFFVDEAMQYEREKKRQNGAI